MADNPADMAQTLKENKEMYEGEQTRLWKELGPVFLQARERAGLTQKMVAELVDISDVTIHNVETGQGQGACSVELLSRISAILTMPYEARLEMMKDKADETS